MNRILFSIVLVFSQLALFAQQAILKGKVIDALSNEALPFVSVVIAGTTNGTATDENGNFQFKNLMPGFVRIQTSSIGYHLVLSAQIEVKNAKASYFGKLKKARYRLKPLALQRLRKVREQTATFHRL